MAVLQMVLQAYTYVSNCMGWSNQPEWKKRIALLISRRHRSIFDVTIYRGSPNGLMMKSGMELRRLEDDYKAMVVQTIDITD